MSTIPVQGTQRDANASEADEIITELLNAAAM